jgi:hypothetical protein
VSGPRTEMYTHPSASDDGAMRFRKQEHHAIPETPTS